MSRAGEGGRLGKRNGCLTCLVVCLILLIVFIAALFIGGSVLFKSHVSPKIGGVTLSESLSILSKVLSGKETKATYAEEDLDDFYSGLSSALFLSEKSEAELEYEILPESAKEALDVTRVAAAEEEDEEKEDDSYDEDASFAAFLLLPISSRYALLSSDVKALVSIEEYSCLAAEESAAVRKRLGLKTYRLSIRSILGDEGFSATDFAADKLADRAFSSLDFNFESLENYDITDPSAPENTEFTTFSVTGKQVSAFVNDVLQYFLSGDSSPFKEQMAAYLPANASVTDYVKVASVTIKNTPLLVSNGEALYDQKDTELGVTVSVKLRDFVKVLMQSDEVKNRLSGAPSFAIEMIPSLVPKYLSLSACVYPLAEEADGREIKVKVNNMSDKAAKNLSKIVNGLMGRDAENGAEKSFFAEMNDKVTEVFSSINEKVKINFVPTLDADGNALKDSSGNTYSELQIMTIETLLSLLDDSGTLSAHEVFTVLKCLYVTTVDHDPLSLDASVSAFKSDMAGKYGVDLSFLDENNLLSSDSLKDILNHIHLSDGLDFTRSNEEMQVHLSAEALASLMVKFVSEFDPSGDESVAAAEGSSSRNIFEGIHPNVCEIALDKVSEKDGRKIFSLELLISFDIAKLLSPYLPSEGTGSKLISKILPKGNSYFGIKLFVSEERADGKLIHKAGKNIAKEGESADVFQTMLRVNDFTYEETASVMDTINRFMTVLGGSDGFDLSSVTDSLEDVVTNLFETLQKSEFPLSLRFFPKDENSNGGILLPSIYELVESLVTPRLSEGESFTSADAQEILALLYASNADKTVSFSEEQADDFLSEINDKFYISYDSRLTSDDLFGDGAEHLSDKIGAGSLYFVSSEEEKAKWGSGYEKPALYSDSRDISELRVSLTGGEIASLIQKSSVLPEDLSSSFGGFSPLGARFITEEGETYLAFDLLCTFFEKTSEENGGDGEEEPSFDLSVLFPKDLKLSAKILMYAPSYSEEKPRFSSSIAINDGSAEKIFFLLKAFGGDSLSESALSGKIGSALEKVFQSLESKIPVYYSEGGVGYKVTVNGKEENCIYLSDVFTALISLTGIQDSVNEDTGETIPEEDRSLSSALSFRAKLKEFGRMPSYSFEGDASDWEADVSGVNSFFTESDLTSFLSSLSDNYYLSSPITAEKLMGSEKSFDVNASSVSFLSLYADERPVSELTVRLTGGALGALFNKTLGSISIGEEGGATLVQSAIRIDSFGTTDLTDDKAFLDLCFLVSLSSSSSILPKYLFVKAEVDLSYDFVNARFPSELTCSAKITINDLSFNQTKNLFGYIASLGGNFSMDSISEKIADGLKDGISGMLSLYPEGTVKAQENAIVLPDVFTFLVSLTSMTDQNGNETAAQDLASRLRGFGYQLNENGDPENHSDYSWVNGLKLFLSTDDAYVYSNMQRAYFMKNKPDMDMIYDGVGDLFSTIDDSSFNLTGEDGLYLYDGDIRTLKISDKALGVMIKNKQSFSSAVSGSGVSASIESVKIYFEDTSFRLESGLKISLTGENYAMLPSYFFVKAVTKEDPSSSSGYSTEITVNNLSREQTVNFFHNFTSLSSVGIETGAFTLSTLESAINSAVSSALNSFSSSVSVSYGCFTDGDISSEYNDANYPDDFISVSAGDGYLEIPSVYYFLIDLLYDSSKPEESEMQHMLNKLYESDTSLNANIVLNPASDTAFQKEAVYRGENPITDRITIYSDRYLASEISTDLSGENINGDIDIEGILQLTILKAGDAASRALWKNKFFTDAEDFNASHDYMIATAVASLSNYSSGGSTSLVPEKLWFTVLIDLTNESESRGLLYDMNQKDMEIFEHILSSNNDKFSINEIAVELASLIVDKIGHVAGVGLTVRYYGANDDYYFAETLPFSSNQENVKDSVNGASYVVVSIN